ncbi:MAG: hypothetical protein ACXAC8_13045 [Candidatus Hodarchaeales archaeon]|jgi:hypothetical protein
MTFPFALKSSTNWIDFVPEFLITLSADSEFVQNAEFLQYLSSKLDSFYSDSPHKFLEVISRILTEATESGKYVILETILQTRRIWTDLSRNANIQPILTELALSNDRIYSKSAVQLSSFLEEIKASLAKELPADQAFDSDLKGEGDFEESSLDDILETTLRDISKKKRKLPTVSEQDFSSGKVKEEKVEIPSPPVPSAPPPGTPSVTTPAPSVATQSVSPKSTPPSSPRKKSAPPKSTYRPKPSPAPIPTSTQVADPEEKKGIMKEPTLISEEIEPLEAERKTMHTHIHYYSRMNPRKTYPFTITLSHLMKKIAADKQHLLSGEKESETRGEFELTKYTKRLTIEPLLSGCLVQPTVQFVDPSPQNLPKELTYYITPLVETGFRSTTLKGVLFIKDEKGSVLLRLDLPGLAVTSNRVSQVAALIGTIGGGGMPAIDSLFGTNLQSSLVTQLGYFLPQFAQSIDMGWFVTGAQILLLTGAFGIGLLWWWKKGRAKIAPEKAVSLQVPQY